MPDWYYAKGNKQQGPVTTETLKELADSGDLQPADMVWHAGMANWAPASSSSELFPGGVGRSQRGPSRPEEEPPLRKRRRRPRDDDYDDDDEEYERRPRRAAAVPARRGLSTGAWVAIIGGTVGGLGLIVGIIIWVVVANTPRQEGRQLFPPTSVNARLDHSDRRFQNKNAEFFPIRMTQNRQYVIEMNSNEFDCFLYLRDPTGKIVAANDDGGPGLNSRIFFRPRSTGLYTIIATSFGGGRRSGRFTLNVR